MDQLVGNTTRRRDLLATFRDEALLTLGREDEAPFTAVLNIVREWERGSIDCV